MEKLDNCYAVCFFATVCGKTWESQAVILQSIRKWFPNVPNKSCYPSQGTFLLDNIYCSWVNTLRKKGVRFANLAYILFKCSQRIVVAMLQPMRSRLKWLNNSISWGLLDSLCNRASISVSHKCDVLATMGIPFCICSARRLRPICWLGLCALRAKT